MGINLENPQTLVELIDAASNYVAQIKIARLAGDRLRAEYAQRKAERFLFDAMQKAQEQEELLRSMGMDDNLSH